MRALLCIPRDADCWGNCMLSRRTEGHSLPYLQCGQFKGVQHHQDCSASRQFVHIHTRNRNHTPTIANTAVHLHLWENDIWSKCIQLISNKLIEFVLFFSTKIWNSYLTRLYLFSAVCVFITVFFFFYLLFSVTIDLYLAISFINNRWERDKNRANCHLCAGLNSEQGTTWSINILLSVKELTVNARGQKGPDEKPEVSGESPRSERRNDGVNESETAGWFVWDSWLCQGYSCQTWSRHGFQPRPCCQVAACCHTWGYLSLSLNGFPGFLMTAQSLFMSWGPITKTNNAALCTAQLT